MVKLKRGKKKGEEVAAAAPAAHAEPQNGDAAPGPQPEMAMAAAPAQSAQPEAATWEPPAPTYGSAAPSSSGRGGLFNRMYGDVGEQSAAERDRQAEAEFRQVLAPAMDLLHASVPEASSPEEAARILEQKAAQVELVPDPQGGAFVRGDAFDTDARVYYRLLRRDYEKTPRPSEKRQQSHHLHQVYGKLPGTRGW